MIYFVDFLIHTIVDAWLNKSSVGFSFLIVTNYLIYHFEILGVFNHFMDNKTIPVIYYIEDQRYIAFLESAEKTITFDTFRKFIESNNSSRQFDYSFKTKFEGEEFLQQFSEEQNAEKLPTFDGSKVVAYLTPKKGKHFFPYIRTLC